MVNPNKVEEGQGKETVTVRTTVSVVASDIVSPFDRHPSGPSRFSVMFPVSPPRVGDSYVRGV